MFLIDWSSTARVYHVVSVCRKSSALNKKETTCIAVTTHTSASGDHRMLSRGLGARSVISPDFARAVSESFTESFSDLARIQSDPQSGCNGRGTPQAINTTKPFSFPQMRDQDFHRTSRSLKVPVTQHLHPPSSPVELSSRQSRIGEGPRHLSPQPL